MRPSSPDVAPAVESGVEAAGGAWAIAEVPESVSVEFGFHELAKGVGHIQGVDQAGGLASFSAGVAVVFRADQFDV